MNIEIYLLNRPIEIEPRRTLDMIDSELLVVLAENYFQRALSEDRRGASEDAVTFWFERASVAATTAKRLTRMWEVYGAPVYWSVSRNRPVSIFQETQEAQEVKHAA